MAAALEVTELVTGYGEVQILWGVSLRLEPGRLTALVGSNGAGKTTLLRAATGLLPAWRGSVVFAGHDVTRLPAHARAAEGLALVPEGRQLFADMTVLENLELGAFSRRAQPGLRRNLERVFEMFPRLADRRGQKAGTLSGGEQQMVAVARGLMAEPKVLMLDELSLGLSPRLVLDLFESLRRLKAEGLTMLLVEQNVAMAMAVSDYAYVLAEGRVHLEGEASALARKEEVRRAYLGL
ncbi:ABC transporter ATP-binding protein [Sorangium sp. So ce185]|uniref:ABC transporter ATP-binding protein n=1 Tax=Sorangium sp. So ce185 TaxID=3133287 RepID=UPI003F5F8E25